MPAAPACPSCEMDNTYPDGANYVCADCGHEWPAAEASRADDDAGDLVEDANGTALANGDAVVLIKDLKVKGSSITLKMGTRSRASVSSMVTMRWTAKWMRGTLCSRRAISGRCSCSATRSPPKDIRRLASGGCRAAWPHEEVGCRIDRAAPHRVPAQSGHSIGDDLSSFSVPSGPRTYASRPQRAPTCAVPSDIPVGPDPSARIPKRAGRRPSPNSRRTTRNPAPVQHQRLPLAPPAGRR